MISRIGLDFERRVPAGARGIGAATAAVWAGALLLFVIHVRGDLPLGAGATQMLLYWLLAVGCTGFWATFMRVGAHYLSEDWHLAYELDLTSILAPGPNRRLDRLLARGLGRDRPPDFWPPATWRTLRALGAAFWALSAAFTGCSAFGYPRLDGDDRGVLLVILMIPAVQCTAAGIIGPGLTRMLELREGAREARRRVCEHSDQYQALHELNRATPEQLLRASELMVRLAESQQRAAAAQRPDLQVVGARRRLRRIPPTPG